MCPKWQSLAAAGLAQDVLLVSVGSFAPMAIRVADRLRKQGIGVTVVYCAIATFILLKVIDVIEGLRVSTDQEREGLDVHLHGEVVA